MTNCMESGKISGTYSMGAMSPKHPFSVMYKSNLTIEYPRMEGALSNIPTP